MVRVVRGEMEYLITRNRIRVKMVGEPDSYAIGSAHNTETFVASILDTTPKAWSEE